MVARADVVIVGGGIMGVSLAFALTKMGVSDVMVLERHTIASGASGKTGALLRLHYSNEPEARLAHLSHQVFENWAEVVGGDCGFVKSGVVVTVATRGDNADNIEKMHRNVAMQNEIGIASQVVSADDLYEMQPFLKVDDIDVAAYEPESGYVDSVAATRSMAEAAAHGGARIVEECEVIGLNGTDSRVSGAETTDGTIEANTVVMASGAWSTSLLDGIGVDVPVEAERVQAVVLNRPLSMPVEGTMSYVDTAAGVFFRNWGPNRTYLGIGAGEFHQVVEPNWWDPRNNLSFPSQAAKRLSERIPAMSGASYLSGQVGLYDMTPDAHPILDSVTGLDGLYLMIGFSGAGFKKGPAIGQSMAELIVRGKASTVDLAPFGLSRFDDDCWREPWSENEYSLSSDFGHGF